MRALYSLVYALLLPIIFARLLLRSVKNPQYRNRWPERIGLIPRLPANSECIWVHAVSVGETLAAVELIRALQKTWPNKTVLVTTMTPTGSEQVKRVFADSVAHVYAPYDLPCFVTWFLKAVKPQLAVIMETELWPNIINGCTKCDIPTLVVNARLSEKSLKGYEKISSLSRPMVKQVSGFVVQSQADAQRFEKLGVKPEKITVAGNIKFDLTLNDKVKTISDQLKAQINQQQHRPVWVAASTHEGEDEIILSVFTKLLTVMPSLLLVLVPRHPERFSDVHKQCLQAGLATLKRSTGEALQAQHQVLLGDTMGELLSLLGVADVAFIGGSFVEVGGHNMIEPAAWGVPVVTGPSLFNFHEASELLVGAGAMTVCENEQALERTLLKLLQDQTLRQQQGQLAQQVVAQNRGALAKQLAVIKSQLGQS